MLCFAVLLAAGLDHGAFIYEARALINGSKVKIGSLQYSTSCAYENMRIRQVTSEIFSHLGLPGATTSFLYF